MLSTAMLPGQPMDAIANPKKRCIQSAITKRPHSTSPVPQRLKSPVGIKKPGTRRCQSLSPSNEISKKSLDRQVTLAPISASVPATAATDDCHSQAGSSTASTEKEPVMPQCVVAKMLRLVATKKREFLRLRKSVIQQQNALLDQYASLKDLESRAGVPTDESLGDVRILSVSGWPAYDLLLLVRDDLQMPMKSEISGLFGSSVLQQLKAQLNSIPNEVVAMSEEIMAQRNELLNLVRGKNRTDRTCFTSNNGAGSHKNLERKTRNTQLDQDLESLHRMVMGTAENLRAKINYSLELARIPWLDRETLVKKIERVQKENMILQHKIEETSKKVIVENIGDATADVTDSYQALSEELSKERAAREALKDVVSAAESMLRVARARITTLERQLKDTRAELETARRKQKDLEQLYRHRETSFDTRSKKLLEASKTGEMTIEALSRQRDALELRVKELREQAEMAERAAEVREAEQKAHTDSLQAKVAAQEKARLAAENRVMELETKIKQLEEQFHALRESAGRLVEIERKRCPEYIPKKETEPSDRETKIWKELEVTRVALFRAEEELRLSHADKDNFLNSLSRIAQGENPDNFQDKMTTELLDRERKVMKLQQLLDEQHENKKTMEQTVAQYKSQLASLRLEVKRLRNYHCYSKELQYQELQTELLEMHMQVETLCRERTALVTAAASRALMLERHERSAELFAKVINARRQLAALIDGQPELPIEKTVQAEISRSLSSMCTNAADTWSALRVERARVLRLESAVLAQTLQLEREGRVRTQLEHRRAMLEREILRVDQSASSNHNIIGMNPSFALN